MNVCFDYDVAVLACYRERNTELIKEAIHMRYMLLPYFYTLFRESNATGVPVARPLWMEFPGDENTYSNDEAMMVGNSILVQGVYTEVSCCIITLHMQFIFLQSFLVVTFHI